MALECRCLTGQTRLTVKQTVAEVRTAGQYWYVSWFAASWQIRSTQPLASSPLVGWGRELEG